MHQYFFTSNLKSRLSSVIAELNARHMLIVHGHRSYAESGAEGIVKAALEEAGAEGWEFTEFDVNPKIEDVRRGLEFCQGREVDGIIAVGGGSAMDVAKLIKYYMLKEGGREVPVIAIPTTAGTGAEATHFSVCYIDGEKQSIADDCMLPDYAIIYPPLTYGNSPYLTACTGFDAVAQAIESYWSVASSVESRDFSIRALKLLWKGLPSLIADLGNHKLRDDVAQGAYFAGRAINLTTTTAPHAFSYKFTSLYGYPHGHAVALSFPFFFALNSRARNLRPTLDPREYENRMDLLFALIGYDKTTDPSEFMASYIKSLGLTLPEFTKEQLDPIINGFNEKRAANNPVVIEKERLEVRG